MSPRQIVTESAAAVHQTVLKPLGYRKSGFNWVLAGDWTRIINLQLSRWNTADNVQFTLNFGIFIEPLHRLAERPAPSGALKEYDCMVRARYGSLTPSGEDYWWSVSSQTRVAELANEISAALVTYALPWFDTMTDFRSVGREFDVQEDAFMAALAYHLAGEPALARQRMDAAMAQANVHFKRKAERIAASLDLKG